MYLGAAMASKLSSGSSNQGSGTTGPGDEGNTTSLSSVLLVPRKLNGADYLEWSQTMKLAIDGREKLGFITSENCWGIQGKPLNWKPRGQNNGGSGDNNRANQVSSEPSEKSSGPLSFTKEQLDHLSQLPANHTSPKCNLAESGNIFALSIHNSRSDAHWIIDSGATDHMTYASEKFESYLPCGGNQKVRIADGSYAAIAGKGSIPISPNLTLHGVLHIPKLSCNLISVNKLVSETNCKVMFSPVDCKLHDASLGKEIGSARVHNGLYILEEDAKKIGRT